MGVYRIPDDAYFDGKIVANEIDYPAGSIMLPDRQRHQHAKHYAQNGTAAAATVAVHECRGATATVRQVRVGSVVACIGDSTVTVDVKKNGSTILSSTVQLDSGNTAYVSEAGTINTSSLASGDVLTVVVTVSAGTGTLATGLWVELRIDEDYAS